MHCILYGAAEFTRDVDCAVAVGTGNLDRLRVALDDLQAEPVFFPRLSAAVLRRGHACHFRSRAAGLHGLRIDVMSTMRGVDSFSTLWARREEFDLPGVGIVAVLALPDPVRAKKTQRDKDWPTMATMNFSVPADVRPRRGPGLRALAVIAAPVYRARDFPMLDRLTIDSFTPHVGTSFWLQAGERRVELRLTRAAKVMESEAVRLNRSPFSLFFLAPVLMPQQIYRLTHEAFPEPLDIFLVPVAKDAGGFTHEAVFT